MDGEKEYEQIGRMIYGLHRAGLDEERLKELALDATHPEQAARAGRMLQLFEEIVGRGGRRLEGDQLTAALEEAWRLFQALHGE
ncbi:hypothetical protein LK540_18675 [Massilia sp. IC2-278]|uniref:hypothetical protein n=1 Tax=Massilia sp. IC2-278 TaxID=2887200 RepID=UPI001E551E6B|nr:hypothetical protein [Massilia sp. IC2-278]MCC2962456.1 hypothetical protein [Massilia sp. IC2-278]